MPAALRAIEGRRPGAIAILLASLAAPACRVAAPPEPAAARSPGVVAAPDPAPAPQVAAPRVIRPFPGVVALPDQPAVEFEGWVCLEGGRLEEIVCAPGTREHEALVVARPRAREIHAALLLAGFAPGAPGRWAYEGGEVRFTPPSGAALDVVFRYRDGAGALVEAPARSWIREHQGRREFPREPWIFGGSRFEPAPAWMEQEGEHYVADSSGSIVGLVTFGDETIGFSRVLADETAVQPAEWQADSDRLPPLGTPVTVILRPWE